MLGCGPPFLVGSSAFQSVLAGGGVGDARYSARRVVVCGILVSSGRKCIHLLITVVAVDDFFMRERVLQTGVNVPPAPSTHVVVVVVVVAGVGVGFGVGVDVGVFAAV